MPVFSSAAWLGHNKLDLRVLQDVAKREFRFGSLPCMQHRPAQFAEETKRADNNVAYGLITSTILEAAMGLAFVLSFLFCLPVRLPS